MPGRSILDNVLLAQELLKDYGKVAFSPTVVLKQDISKAYDTVQWSSIVRIMANMGFPKTFVSWIYTCISTPSFSVIINGRPIGYFKSKCGIRQDGPISSYLFLLVMEVFTKMLQTKYISRFVRYHPKCKPLNISSIMLLMTCLFLRNQNIIPEHNSLTSIVDTLHDFRLMTGLKLNPTKTSILLFRVSDSHASMLYQSIGFQSMSNDM